MSIHFAFRTWSGTRWGSSRHSAIAPSRTVVGHDWGSYPATLKQATRTIPIVFAVVNDPLGQGFIASPSGG
jgi:hypothetical protein